MPGEIESTSSAVEAALTTLIRGLTLRNRDKVYAGHRDLCRIGVPAIPQIRHAIEQSNWSKVQSSSQLRYVTGLVSVLHDIDEAESDRIVKQLKRNGCDVSVAGALDSIRAFTADYTQYETRGIRIFEHKDLAVKRIVRPMLEKWLMNVPQEDLTDVERIYVMRPGDLKASGNYTPILFSINLVWDNPCSRWNPFSWVFLLAIESTLYHEIGHHLHRHTFGQDSVQEAEANKYSNYLMLSKSSQWIYRVGRLIVDIPSRPDRKRKGGS